MVVLAAIFFVVVDQAIHYAISFIYSLGRGR